MHCVHAYHRPNSVMHCDLHWWTGNTPVDSHGQLWTVIKEDSSASGPWEPRRSVFLLDILSGSVNKPRVAFLKDSHI